MDVILRSVASIGGERIIALHGAAKEGTEVLVQVGKEGAWRILALVSTIEQ